jgi:hypothetical protein
MAVPRLSEDDDAVAVAVAVAVTVTTDALAVADAIAAEREDNCASMASVPGLKARPVLPKVKLLPQQLALECAYEPQQNCVGYTPETQG